MGSSSSTGFAMFWQNPHAGADARSSASIGGGVGQQPVELGQYGLVGSSGRSAQKQKLRRYPCVDLQIAEGWRRVEARLSFQETERASQTTKIKSLTTQRRGLGCWPFRRSACRGGTS